MIPDAHHEGMEHPDVLYQLIKDHQRELVQQVDAARRGDRASLGAKLAGLLRR